jgi:hypothetical protein
MVKITIKQLIAAMGTQENSPIKKLAALDLPFRVSWEFSETLLDAQTQSGRVTELSKKLFNKYSQPKEEGSQEMVIMGDNLQPYLDEAKEMEETVLELDGCLVPKSLIEKKEKNELSGADVIALRPFIDKNA